MMVPNNIGSRVNAIAIPRMDRHSFTKMDALSPGRNNKPKEDSQMNNDLCPLPGILLLLSVFFMVIALLWH
jgi:hypothetical protein